MTSIVRLRGLPACNCNPQLHSRTTDSLVPKAGLTNPESRPPDRAAWAKSAGRHMNDRSLGRRPRAGSSLDSQSTLGGLPPSLVVFSGGTAFNSVAGAVRQLTTRVTYVLPVSDDGGSTAEIVRVLGGPAVGDIRSRCLRLADDSDEEARAVKKLLAHRLNSHSSAAAKAEWNDIVEGQHALWQGLSEPYKHTIRSFLVYFHTQLLHHTTKRFDFCNGSVGNFFFAGVRLFVGSLEAAIFLFSRVARIPNGSLVLPAILAEEHTPLGAQLADGTVIRGQNAISHPSPGVLGSPGPHTVQKGDFVPLSAPVQRVFYLSTDAGEAQHEVRPPVNPRVLAQIDSCHAIVYGIGSLFTSICPTLVLQGLGEAIAACQAPKVFLLNGSPDREVCYHHKPLQGVPFTCAARQPIPQHAQPSQQRTSSQPPPLPPQLHSADRGSPGSTSAPPLPHSTQPGHPPDAPSEPSASSHPEGRPPGQQADAEQAPSLGRSTPVAAGSQPDGMQAHRAMSGSSASGPQQALLSSRHAQTAPHHLRRVSISDDIPAADTDLRPEPHPPAGNGVGQAHSGNPSPGHAAQDFTFDQGRDETEGTEGGAATRCMSASEMVLALCDALNRRQAARGLGPLQNPPSAYVSALIVPKQGSIEVDRDELARLGVLQVHVVDSVQDDHGRCVYDPDSLVAGIDTVLREAQSYDI